MTDNYTPIFNEVLEALCKINLSPYETRVLFCIWRKTYGFIDPITKLRKKYDWLAGSQISQMTKLDRRYVSRALKGLKNKNVISRDDKKTGFSKQFMSLMSSVEMTIISRDDKKDVKNVPVEMTPTPSRDDNLSSVEGHTKEKKETITKENRYIELKNLEEQDFEEIAQKYQVPLSFVKSKFDDMEIWAGSMPNNKKIKDRNWRLTLMGFVKKDSLQLRKEASLHESKRGIDARNIE